MVNQLVIEQLSADLLRAEASAKQLVDLVADLTLENTALKLLIGRLNKGCRVERDALREELERFTRAQVNVE